jgi:hypothetical protein
MASIVREFSTMRENLLEAARKSKKGNLVWEVIGRRGRCYPYRYDPFGILFEYCCRVGA